MTEVNLYLEELKTRKNNSNIFWPLVWCEHSTGTLPSMVVYWQTSFSALLQGFAFNFHGDPGSLDFPLSQLASTMFASFDSVWPHQSLGRRAPGTRWRPNRDRGQVRTRNFGKHTVETVNIVFRLSLFITNI